MLMTYYAKLAYYRFISSIRGYTGFWGRGGGGVLGKFLDPRMFSFVTQLLNIVRLFMLQIVC